MGKYALLLVLAGGLAMSLMAYQGMLTNRSTSEEQAERQAIVIARTIAKSAYEKGISDIRRNFGSITDHTEEDSFNQGTYLLRFNKTTSGGEPVIKLRAEGTFQDTTYQITSRADKDTSVSGLFNGITANLPIDFNVDGGGCSGGPCISGFDASGGKDRHGISLPSSGDPGQVCNEFDGEVVGKGGGCDVVKRSPEKDEWVANQMEALESDIQDAAASGSDNVTVCNDCEVGNLADSTGILYVTGELRYNGEETWKGLVFVAEGGRIRINGGGEVRNIDGGLVLEDSTNFRGDDFDLNGGNAVQYNSDQLRKYAGTAPTITQTHVQITGRSEQTLR